MFEADFRRQSVPWTTGPDRRTILPFAERVTTLHQVAGNSAMDGCFRIKPVLHEFFKVGHRVGRGGLVEGDRETASLLVFLLSPLQFKHCHGIGLRSHP
jgi:hypothetical protein